MSKFVTPLCSGIIKKLDNTVEVTGMILDTVKDGRIKFLAAAPTDRRASFSGSGLPFGNPEQAFHNTPNSGFLELALNNKFAIRINMPGSYYEKVGTVLIPPTLFIFYNDGLKNKTIDIKLTNGTPYRTLTYQNQRTGPLFYAGNDALEITTQEQILLNSEYPASRDQPEDFWGLRPRN